MSIERKKNHGDTAGNPRAAWTWMLVAMQFICLGYMVLTGRLVAHSPWLVAAQVTALALGAWALAVMRPHRVNVGPAPRRDAKLVTTGPYRWIRHPMYASLLVLSAAWLVDVFTPGRLAVWVIFVANMAVKLTFEERYLGDRFDRYREYRRGTWRVIPFVY